MTMTTGGWIFLVLAWSCILGLVLFCMTKVLRGKQDKHE